MYEFYCKDCMKIIKDESTLDHNKKHDVVLIKINENAEINRLKRINLNLWKFIHEMNLPLKLNGFLSWTELHSNHMKYYYENLELKQEVEKLTKEMEAFVDLAENKEKQLNNKIKDLNQKISKM